MDYKEILKNFLHEVDTLNSIIKGSAEILSKSSKGKMNKPAIEYYSEIILENSFLLATQYDIVNYQMNPELLTIESVSPRNIYGKFQKAALSFRRLIKQKKIKISIEGEVKTLIESYPVIDTIPILILDNAVKYSPSNAEVTIVFEEMQDVIYITVSNLGPKLHSEEIERIFEKGFRGKEATNSGIKGKGFGLSFLKDICKLHLATCSAKSSDCEFNLNGLPYSEFSLQLTFPKKIKIQHKCYE